MVRHDALRPLVSHRGSRCVTLTLPTAVRGKETREGPIRLKNLVREVAEVLDRDSELDREILAWLEAFEDDHEFWQHQREGLLLLAGEGVREAWKLPMVVPEAARVDRRFHLKSAIRLANSPSFEVLAFSRGSVRLLSCDASHVDVVEVPGLTESLSEFMQLDEDPGAVEHREDGVDDRRTEDLKRYARAVAKRIDRRRLAMNAPPTLFLAATERDAAAYRNHSRDPRIDPVTIEGNHDRSDPESLRAAAWEHREGGWERDQAAARDRGLQAIASDRGSDSLPRVLAAAHQGLVHAIFAASDVAVPGHYSVGANAVLRTDPDTPMEGDLVDEAACVSLLYGADVHVVPKEHLPSGNAVAAQFRS
ncbi:MAG: hypothetical protein AAGB93_05225 [Planctomycetota bacterium]